MANPTGWGLAGWKHVQCRKTTERDYGQRQDIREQARKGH